MVDVKATVPELFHNPVNSSEDEEANLIMDLVTGPQFTEVGQPSRSGTCSSVSQLVPETVSSLSIKSRLCVQSKPAGTEA